jgi:hypothetical protein
MIKYTVLNDQLTDQQSSPALVYVKGLKFIIYPVKIVKNQIKKDKNLQSLKFSVRHIAVLRDHMNRP